jgi:hypothetical protein
LTGSWRSFLLVQAGVLVDLDDPDVLVLEVILHPLGVYQYVLGVVRHVASPPERKKLESRAELTSF